MITESKQFFDITYYGSHDVVNPLGKTQIDYGQELTEKDTQKIYVEGKKSIGYWYYCDYDESTNSISETEYEMVAGIGSEVFGNEYVICNYVSSLKQSVNFNYWDITLNNGLGGYSESIEINPNYILYPDKVSDENFDLNGFKFNEETGKYSINDFGGRIVKLPTPASELWPTGTFFAGYVISDSAPASGYFTLDAFNSLPKFDNTVMVEEEFTVYAVYEEMRFNLSVISGVARVDLSFGEILPDGTVDLFDKQDVYVIGLTIGQKAIIDSAQEGDLVFADPPYTVKHNNNGFVKYNEDMFKWEDQVRLRDAIVRATERNVKIIVTNANHSSIIELYSNFKRKIISRASVIAASSNNRGKYEEIIIRNM